MINYNHERKGDIMMDQPLREDPAKIIQASEELDTIISSAKTTLKELQDFVTVDLVNQNPGELVMHFVNKTYATCQERLTAHIETAEQEKVALQNSGGHFKKFEDDVLSN